MKAKSKVQNEPTLAATVAGEDITVGQYVAVLTEIVDVPSYLWVACGEPLSPHELVRLQLIPSDAGQPYKVIAVCLPFVYTKSPKGDTVTFDSRQVQLVRLDRRCAKQVWKELQRKKKRKKK